AVALVVLRPVLRARAPVVALDDSGPGPHAALPAATADPGDGAARLPAPSGPISPAEFELPPPVAQADAVARLRELMRERQEESVRILSGWIRQKEEA